MSNPSLPTIILRRTSEAWLATFTNDPDVLEAFGTDTIPTAFTGKAPEDMVREAIQARNPHHRVIISR